MALTVTYTYGGSGTVPPTIAQALNINMVVATVEGADADTATLVTHNFQVTAAQLANLFPLVTIRQSAAGTAASTVIIALTNSVAITFTKATGAGNSGTWVLAIWRPMSIVT